MWCRFLGTALGLSSFAANAAQGQRAQYDSVIDMAYKPNEPGGVVLIARGRSVIYERAFGLANLEHNVPMRTDAVFSIASMTKQFTAVAVLQLVERGTISLRDTLGKFHPAYPSHLRGITIEQLLTHTAGVPAAKSLASLPTGRGWLSADQVTATFRDQPLDFVPGTKMLYSNSGYQLLGLILEKATGQPYAEYMEATLLKPLGMTHSLYGNDMRIIPGRPQPYVLGRNGFENAMNGNVQAAFSAGALQSTAQDFLTWQRALVEGRVIGKAMLDRAWTTGTLSNGTRTDYGFGWFVGALQGHPLVEHGGNMGGYMSHAIYLPRDSVLVVVLLNGRGNRLPELTATDLAALAIGAPLRMTPIALSPSQLAAYVGSYRNADGQPVTIGVENGKLFYQRESNPKLWATPYAADRIFFEGTSIVGEFRRDGSGDVTSLGLETLRGTSRSVVTRVRQ